MSTSAVSEAMASSVSVSPVPAFRAPLDRIAALRVKIKNLAQEAGLIRVEENRALARPLRDSKNPKKRAKAPLVRDFERYLRHKHHRTGTVAYAARTNQLAYGCLRGMPYARIESYTQEEPAWGEIEKIVVRFAFGEWTLSAVAAYREQRERDREAAAKAAAQPKSETQESAGLVAKIVPRKPRLSDELVARLAEVEAHWAAWFGEAKAHFDAMEMPPVRAAREAAHREQVAKDRAASAAYREAWRARYANMKGIPITRSAIDPARITASVREPVVIEGVEDKECDPNGG